MPKKHSFTEREISDIRAQASMVIGTMLPSAVLEELARLALIGLRVEQGDWALYTPEETWEHP